MVSSSERVLSAHLRNLANVYPPLSQAREKELVSDAQAGSTRAANLLVLHHSRLAYKLARHYRDAGLAADDVFSTAFLGVAHAVAKFDSANSVRFVTYAQYWARHFITQQIRATVPSAYIPQSRISMEIYRNMRAVSRMIDKAELDQEGEDSLDRFARRYDTAADNVREIFAAFTSAYTVSADTVEIVDYTSHSPIDAIATRQDRKLFLAVVNSVLQQKSPRAREMFLARHFVERPVPFKDLAEKYGITVQGVNASNNRIMVELRDAFRARIIGPESNVQKDDASRRATYLRGPAIG